MVNLCSNESLFTSTTLKLLQPTVHFHEYFFQGTYFTTSRTSQTYSYPLPITDMLSSTLPMKIMKSLLFHTPSTLSERLCRGSCSKHNDIACWIRPRIRVLASSCRVWMSTCLSCLSVIQVFQWNMSGKSLDEVAVHTIHINRQLNDLLEILATNLILSSIKGSI